MQLSIHGNRLILEVQRDFNSAYPFLKIEFFTNDLKKESRYDANQKISPHLRLKYCWKWKKDSGQLDIVDSMTVLELENAFMNEFGLSVQVFRKSGNVWLETTITDHWTLKQQSDHGREISLGNKSRHNLYNGDSASNLDND